MAYHYWLSAPSLTTVSSSPPPPQRVQLGVSPSRVFFCNLRANYAAAQTLRTILPSVTVSASSVSSDSVVVDRDEAGRIPLLEVKDLRAVIVESRIMETAPTLPDFALALKPDEYQLPVVESS